MMRMRKKVMEMKTANATWAPSILRSAVGTVGEKKDCEGLTLFAAFSSWIPDSRWTVDIKMGLLLKI